VDWQHFYLILPYVNLRISIFPHILYRPTPNSLAVSITFAFLLYKKLCKIENSLVFFVTELILLTPRLHSVLPFLLLARLVSVFIPPLETVRKKLCISNLPADAWLLSQCKHLICCYYVCFLSRLQERPRLIGCYIFMNPIYPTQTSSSSSSMD